MDLSIVIPAFEESRKIDSDIKAAARFLTEQNLTGEIIVVDDGSNDDTAEVAKKVTVPHNIHLKVIGYQPNRGKGYAVKTGITQTTAKFVMFADTGTCIPFENALKGLEMLRHDTCDIAHGSRKMPDSDITKSQSLSRQIWSKLFHVFVVLYMKIPPELTDTQCGFKIYIGDIARQLYSNCTTEGFAFDIEIILRAKKQNLRIKEFPVEWKWDTDSRLHPTRLLARILSELRTIKRNTADK